MNYYWYYNKQTESPQIFGSLTAISQHTDLKIDKLNYHFSKKKRVKYEDEVHEIHKLQIIRSKN